MENYSILRCRICNSKVTRFLDLGRTHAPEEFRRRSELGSPINTFPLGLSYCPKCGQVQLSHEIPPDVMYKHHFFYDYSITKTGDKHYTELAKLICKRYKLTKKDLVVDAGSNTGKLLQIFRDMGVPKILGVDPATRLVRVARKNGIPTMDSYFDTASAKRIVKSRGQAKIITCNNVFDHVTDLHEFMRGVRILLREDGVFVVEDPYFATFFKTLGHVVYHQQLDYILVKAFAKLFDAHGMELIDCERIPYHGGSIRMFIAFKDVYKVSRHVQEFIDEEDRLFRNEPAALRGWAKRILAQRDDMVRLLKKLKGQGKSIGAMGASAKGNCLLYYSGIGPKTVDFITEKSNLKIGRYTPLGIPIVKDEVLFKRQPDYVLLLAWNFSDELLVKLRPYTSRGGKLIVPIPKLKVVG